MKGWKGAAVLLVLLLMLGGILLVRANGLPEANRENNAATENQRRSEGEVQQSGDAAGESMTGNPEESVPRPPATPEPTPTPSPTPKPLRPISLTETDLPEKLLRPAEHRHFGDIGIVQEYVAGIGLDEAGNHIERGGLSGSVGAEKAHYLALFDFDGNALYDGAFAIFLYQVGAIESHNRIGRNGVS